ncbi:acyltransferase family protein [Salmonirosea aquatica]|uniref:Acyltransferase family protein n=1 Tax=Salmonirosea aquatica TaxID=2654236 RepID=A0A7C9FFW8_9BACT|nr:acyltransferase family protein [Cytophagaceae bacterium SJW1-29]
MPTTQQNRLLELDSLRGLAALGVVVFHFTINENADKLGWEFRYGVTGVDIFFIISGFVIFLTIQKVKKWQDFAVSRLARLYPTFWTCVLITAACVYWYEPEYVSWKLLLANLTMFPVYFGIENLDGVYWTLLVEMIFYLWILAIFLIRGLDKIVTISAVCTAVILLFHMGRNFYPDFYGYITWKVQLLNHFPLFFSGILFYKLKFKGFAWRYVGLIFLCMLAAFYLHDKGGRSMYHVTWLEHNLIIVFYHLVFFLFVVGRLTFLIAPPLLFLGKISYSLYLLHQYIGTRLIHSLNTGLNMNIYLAILVAIGFCIALSYGVTYYVEVPAIRAIKGWYKARHGRKLEEQDTAGAALP